MRKAMRIIPVLLLVVLAASPAVCQYVTRGDFEGERPSWHWWLPDEWTPFGGDPMPNWYYIDPGETEIWGVTPRTPESRGWVGKAGGSPNGYKGAYQQIDTTPGTSYRVDAYGWAYSDNGTAAVKLGIDVSGGTDPSLSSITWSQLTNGTGWRPMSINFTATSAKSTLFMVFDHTQVPGGYTATAFDDITITPGVGNPSFEYRNLALGSTTAPWVIYNYDLAQFENNPELGPSDVIDGLIGPYPYGGLESWWNALTCEPGGGSYFLGAASNFGTPKNGGVYQQVRVVPGSVYCFNARAYTYQQGGEESDSDIALGIDPTGGTDVFSPKIQWWQGHTQGTWQTVSSPLVMSEQSPVTLFIRFANRWALQWHVTAVDQVQLQIPFSGSLMDIKQQPAGTAVAVNGRVVTCPIDTNRGDNRFYIEESDRTAGIAVLPLISPGQLAKGATVYVGGILDQVGGEAVIKQASVRAIGSSTLPKPLGANNLQLGGGASSVQSAVTDRGNGLSPAGLLVTSCGRITAMNAPWDLPYYFYIDDGSGVDADYQWFQDLDGNWQLYAHNRGVKVYHDMLSYFETGQYVSVTGALGIRETDDNGPAPGGNISYYRCIYTRSSAEDIKLLIETN